MEAFGLSFGLLRHVSGMSRLPNEDITTASAVDCVSQCALTVSISVSVFVCVRTGSALSLLYGTSATLEHHHFNHAVMILQSEVNDVPISAVMQSPWPCSQYANGFLC